MSAGALVVVSEYWGSTIEASSIAAQTSSTADYASLVFTTKRSTALGRGSSAASASVK